MILAALIAPVIEPLTVWRVTRRAGNLDESIWAARQMREWLRSRDERETNAEPAVDSGDGPTLSSRLCYHLVLIRFKLRLLALRVLGGLVDWVSR
jgi:hypothetical protein